MKDIEYTFRFVKKIVTTLVLDGIAFLCIGLLLIFFPSLLPYLVSGLFVFLALSFWFLALKVNKFSTLRIPFKK